MSGGHGQERHGMVAATCRICSAAPLQLVPFQRIDTQPSLPSTNSNSNSNSMW